MRPALQLRIRKSELADAARIADWNSRLARETENRALDPGTALAGVKGLMKDKHKGFYLLAETTAASPKPAGQLLVTCEWSDWRNGNFWWIQSVYVDPAFRGQGVFSRLYRHLEELARYRRDVAGLRLYVERHNQNAKNVYESLGMRPTAYDLYEVEF